MVIEFLSFGLEGGHGTRDTGHHGGREIEETPLLF
jgi:hypothetical protein